MSDVDTGDEECEEAYDEDLLKDLNNQIRDIELASILKMHVHCTFRDTMNFLFSLLFFSLTHDRSSKYMLNMDV